MPVTDVEGLRRMFREIPQREMSPDAIVTNGLAFVTEDDENWIVTPYDADREPVVHSKEMEPNYILALLYKWGFEGVNWARIKELER